MNKPARTFAKPLREAAGKLVGESFRRQGFASAELVTRWTEIVGPEIAACSEPVKIQWMRTSPGTASSQTGAAIEREQTGTLVLRVEGPAAIEIQHLAGVICERINRFLGWRAVGRIGLRQAPLRNARRKATPALDPKLTAQIAATLQEVTDDDLRQALARLGAATKKH